MGQEHEPWLVELVEGNSVLRDNETEAKVSMVWGNDRDYVHSGCQNSVTIFTSCDSLTMTPERWPFLGNHSCDSYCRASSLTYLPSCLRHLESVDHPARTHCYRSHHLDTHPDRFKFSACRKVSLQRFTRPLSFLSGPC